MSKLIIDGGVPLLGEIRVQGAKNSVLPILAATVIAGDKCVLHNCPRLRDVDKTDLVLERLGCTVERHGNTVIVDPDGFCSCEICDDLMRAMRSSIIFLGAIITRCGEARVSMPGGCPIGLRPIDLHLKALKELGVSIHEEHGYIICRAKKLKGTDIHLDFPSVGATENIMLASVCAEGTTTILNAAREPEIADLAAFLNAMGARITGAGSSFVTIRGVKKLSGAEYTIMPDRIVAATYLAAAAATDGEIFLTGADPSSMGAMLHVLREMGARINVSSGTIHLKSRGRLKNIHILRTMPYPGFPTDIQSPFMAMSATAEGTVVYVENIFENRFRHVDELVRMGADIKVEGRSAVVSGVKTLYGTRLVARELRGGAALVVAALGAEGTSEISGVEYIDRGYEEIEKSLADCNACIRRVQ
ncbi:MAG: UDP-N-acetylglucosamine 1-carboxyvinyltransferase [bacterium]|nr:UDP-N-acetylglucosamine 1-carboxyvinyltransferase [bacterium]